jgi:hypothetical protein
LSKELPVWNDAETDILPDFHLTYGHALIANAPAVDTIFSRAGIRVLASRPFTGSELPQDVEQKLTFRQGTEMYAIASSDDLATCIFGDRTLFLRPEPWIKLSTKFIVSIVTQQANDEYFYRVFSKQKLIATAAREQGRLRMIGNITVRASYQNRLVAAVTANPPPPASVEKFLAGDMELVITQPGQVFVRGRLGTKVNAVLFTLRF